MKSTLQDLLGVTTLEILQTRGGGFMNESVGVKTEAGKYFVKLNSKSGTFYRRRRLKPQLDHVERDYGDWELMRLWPLLVRAVPRLFSGLDHIVPSLLHGDLHGGNMAQTLAGPVIFDPASFYGHHEMELAISGLFVDTHQGFLASYHSTIPKAPRFDERQKLYKLFFYLNHWNHLGPKFRREVISIMKELAGH